MAGLVRISPINEGERGGFRDSDTHRNDRQEEGSLSAKELIEALVTKHGCTVTPAIVGPNITPGSTSNTRSPRSADAERKAREREEKLKKGWKQLNIDAPLNPLAREFLAAAAEKIKSPKVLKTLRAALENPDLVTIGQRVLKLRGRAGDEVRRLLDL
jgi:hypothetical protein